MKLWIYIVIAIVIIVILWFVWLNSDVNKYGKPPDSFNIKGRGFTIETDVYDKYYKEKGQYFKYNTKTQEMKGITKKEYKQIYYDAMKGEVYDVYLD